MFLLSRTGNKSEVVNLDDDDDVQVIEVLRSGVARLRLRSSVSSASKEAKGVEPMEVVQISDDDDEGPEIIEIDDDDDIAEVDRRATINELEPVAISVTSESPPSSTAEKKPVDEDVFIDLPTAEVVRSPPPPGDNWVSNFSPFFVRCLVYELAATESLSGFDQQTIRSEQDPLRKGRR